MSIFKVFLVISTLLFSNAAYTSEAPIENRIHESQHEYREIIFTDSKGQQSRIMLENVDRIAIIIFAIRGNSR